MDQKCARRPLQKLLGKSLKVPCSLIRLQLFLSVFKRFPCADEKVLLGVVVVLYLNNLNDSCTLCNEYSFNTFPIISDGLCIVLESTSHLNNGYDNKHQVAQKAASHSRTAGGTHVSRASKIELFPRPYVFGHFWPYCPGWSVIYGRSQIRHFLWR